MVSSRARVRQLAPFTRHEPLLVFVHEADKGHVDVEVTGDKRRQPVERVDCRQLVDIVLLDGGQPLRLGLRNRVGRLRYLGGSHGSHICKPLPGLRNRPRHVFDDLLGPAAREVRRRVFRIESHNTGRIHCTDRVYHVEPVPVWKVEGRHNAVDRPIKCCGQRIEGPNSLDSESGVGKRVGHLGALVGVRLDTENGRRITHHDQTFTD